MSEEGFFFCTKFTLLNDDDDDLVGLNLKVHSRKE